MAHEFGPAQRGHLLAGLLVALLMLERVASSSSLPANRQQQQHQATLSQSMEQFLQASSPRQPAQQRQQTGDILLTTSNRSSTQPAHHNRHQQAQDAAPDPSRQQQQQHQNAPRTANGGQLGLNGQTALNEQPQRKLQREISCDELNLIVLAQVSPSLNVDTANRFIECQRIDPTLEQQPQQQQPHRQQTNANGTYLGPAKARALALALASASSVAANSERTTEFTSGRFGGATAPGSGAADDLQFGAKVALLLLTATALLVATATLYDLNRRRQLRADQLSQWLLAKSCCRNQVQAYQQVPASQAAVAARLRDQRSPSLSSTSSSSLFCSSSNSLASASAPILTSGASSRHSAMQAKATTLLLSNIQETIRCARHESDRETTRSVRPSGRRSILRKIVENTIPKAKHYEQNIKMLCGAGSLSSSGSSSSTEASRAAQESEHCCAEGGEPASSNNQANDAHADRWRAKPSGQLAATSCDTCSPDSDGQPTDSSKRPGIWSLLEQVLLSFSLYHSAAVIFETHKRADEQTPAGHLAPCCAEHAGQLSLLLGSRLGGAKAASNSCTSHRSRLPSLSSINETGRAGGGCTQETGNLADPSEKGLLDLGELRLQQQHHHQSIDSLHGLRFLSMIWIIVVHSYSLATRWSFFTNNSALDNIYKTAASQLLSNGTFACDSFFFTSGFLLAYLAFPEAQHKRRWSTPVRRSQSRCTGDGCPGNRSGCSSPDLQPDNLSQSSECSELRQGNHSPDNGACLAANKFTLKRVFANLLHRYIRMMPLMMAVIGLSVTSLRFLGEGPAWDSSTMMFDKWCRKNWWINALFLHNFVNRENMCLSHSWYSAVDIQLYLVGQLVLLALYKSRPIGIMICSGLLLLAPLITGALTLAHHLPAVPLMISSVSEQSLSLYYGEIYIKPYCRASPHLIGILLAYLMRTTSLGQARLKKWQVIIGWTTSLCCLLAILLATQPAMNGQPPGELASALYSALSRPLWACATGWMVFACITKHGGPFAAILSARCFVPLSRLTYPAFLIHPIVMAVFYGSRQESFSHYLMLYLILGHIVITYVLAFVLSALFELPVISAERAVKRACGARR